MEIFRVFDLSLIQAYKKEAVKLLPLYIVKQLMCAVCYLQMNQKYR